MIKFIKEESRLSARQTDYWKKVFNNNLLFASEIECEFEVSGARRSMQNDIESSGSVYKYGNGIETIKSDGSLSNGAEILTPPRRIYSMPQMINGYKSLIDRLYEYEPYINARAGWHNHVSLMCIEDVHANETEIPNIIVTNLLALSKRYLPAMIFMTSTMPEGALTRYEQYSRLGEMVLYDSSKDIVRKIRNFKEERYNALNFNRFDIEDSGTNRFHIEFRFPDCSMFPVQMASFNILIKALIMKSIELSRYGVIQTEEYDSELYSIRNSGSSSTRLSFEVSDGVIEKLKTLSLELVSLLSEEIIKIDSSCLDIVNSFATKPISLMFREYNTKSIQEINEKLEEMVDMSYERYNESYEEIEKIISLGVIKGAETKEEWNDKLGEIVACKEDINDILIGLSKIRKIDFDKRVGWYFV